MEETLNRLSSLPRFQADRSANENEIDEIQSELGVLLPEQFVDFLKRFGHARWYGQIIYGIRPTNRTSGLPSSVISCCLSRTKTARRLDNPLGTAFLPNDHVVIASDGGGGNYVLFTLGTAHEGEVHYYNLEDKAEPVFVWETFQRYLELEIASASVG